MTRKRNVVTFIDLVEFVEQELLVIEQPLWGTLNGELLRKPLLGDGKTRDVSQKCCYCQKDNHRLYDCEDFGYLPSNDKVDFIRENYLCFGCLDVGHKSHDCMNRLSCDTCRKLHPTVLHRRSCPTVLSLG